MATTHDDEENCPPPPPQPPEQEDNSPSTAEAAAAPYPQATATTTESPAQSSEQTAKLRKVRRNILLRVFFAMLFPISMFIFENWESSLLLWIIELWLIFSSLRLVNRNRADLPLWLVVVGRLPITFLLCQFTYGLIFYLLPPNCSPHYVCKPETDYTLYQATGWIGDDDEDRWWAGDKFCWMENVFAEDELGCRNTTIGCNLTDLCAGYK